MGSSSRSSRFWAGHPLSGRPKRRAGCGPRCLFGALRVFALFSRVPLAVLQVESMIARDLERAGTVEALTRLNQVDTGQHSLLLQVVSGPDGADR